MAPEHVLYLLRFVRDAAAMLLWGTYLYLWVLVPPPLGQRIAQTLVRARVAALVVLAVATIAFLPVEIAFIASGWPSIFSATMVHGVLSGTGVGRVGLAQALIAIVLLATVKARVRQQPALTACGTGLFLASLAFSGHAVMQDGLIGIAHQANDVIHVLSAGAWLGALVPLVLILIGLKSTPPDARAALALKRFSTVGHVVVALTILSGICNGALVMGGWPKDWGGPYRMLLAAKVAVVLLMASTALVNRYRAVPDIPKNPAGAIRALRRGTVIEIVLGLAAIGLVAVFGMLDPM
jgi:putative copper resistance protein D